MKGRSKNLSSVLKYGLVAVLAFLGGTSVGSNYHSARTPEVTLAYPTESPTPTLIPTDVYIAPTTPYIPPTQTPADQTNSQLDNNNYYNNSAGNTVHSPANTIDGSVPAGASAICGDGTYSFSQSSRGTCSHHGGVAQWL